MTKNLTIQFVNGDFVYDKTHAIVCPTDESLRNSSGVAKTIATKGGQVLQDQCQAWLANKGPLDQGVNESAYTQSGDLPCDFVIYVVGPMYYGLPKEYAHVMLRNCIFNALERLKVLGLVSISIPSIGSGGSGFPNNECA